MSWAVKQKSETLSQQLETENKSHAKRVSDYLEQKKTSVTALHREMPQLMDELKDEACQQKKRSPIPLCRYRCHGSLFSALTLDPGIHVDAI